jgi:hypothetical protein
MDAAENCGNVVNMTQHVNAGRGEQITERAPHDVGQDPAEQKPRSFWAAGSTPRSKKGMYTFGWLAAPDEGSYRRPLMLGRWPREDSCVVAVGVHLGPNWKRRQVEGFCCLSRADGHDMSGTELFVFDPEFRLRNMVKMSHWDGEVQIGPGQLRLTYSGPSIGAWCLANTKDTAIARCGSGTQYGPWPGVYHVWP